MKSTYIFEARNGKPNFLSEYNRARFSDELKKNEGRKYKIKPVSPKVSDKKRGWYFGGIIPFLKEIMPPWREYTADQIHEILKYEFNSVTLIGIDGTYKKVPQSIANEDVDSEQFDNFILRLSNWVLEEFGMELPDPEVYKEKMDSAEITDEFKSHLKI